MQLDERMMFHLTNGMLRRWSLWNEAVFPTWAVGEEQKYNLFQSWKREPYKIVGNDQYGQPQYKYHPMGEFTNWPLWLILDLLRYIQFPAEYGATLMEPDNLKEFIVTQCEEKYSMHEEQDASHLTQ